jgi:CheY-like chemotaxis protein
MPNMILMGTPVHARPARPHIVVVDGAPDFLNLMRELLQDEDDNVTTTDVVPAVFDQIATAQPDVLTIDLAVTQRAGSALLAALRGRSRRIDPVPTRSQ